MKRVYEFPNGFQTNADATFLFLRHCNLQPEWRTHRDARGGACTAIYLSASDADCLLLMAAHSPARFGNASTIRETMARGEAEDRAEAEKALCTVGNSIAAAIHAAGLAIDKDGVVYRWRNLSATVGKSPALVLAEVVSRLFKREEGATP